MDSTRKLLKFESFRRAQMQQLGFWVAGPISVILVLQSILTDRRLYPELWTTTWLWLRLGIIPVSIFAVMFVRAKRFGGLWADFGVYLIGLYIALFHAYFVSQTGFEQSKYFHSYIQILLGAAILPLARTTFALILVTVLGLYVGTVTYSGIALGKFLTHGDAMFLKTYVMMTVLLYFTARFGRHTGYRAQIALEDELTNRESEIQRLVAEKLDAKRSEALVDLAQQVAHDIRSPLSALEMLTRDLGNVPEERRVILRSAVTRIKNIANNLLDRGHAFNKMAPIEQKSVHLVSALLDNIITEKCVQYSNRSNLTIDLLLEDSSYGAFIYVGSTEFKRMISNLIDNSVEAIPGEGRVIVRSSLRNQKLLLEVEDTGKGITAEVVPKLMRKGASYGKIAGSGLGLFHAKNSVASWGGNISITSRVSIGTQITVELPLYPAPDWFVPYIELNRNSSIAILDDDPAIHGLWSERLKEFGAVKLALVHFSSAEELRVWVHGHSIFNVLFLVDFELLGRDIDGLGLIEELGLQGQSILVTSRSEESDVRVKSKRLQVPLLPKSLAASVPIKIMDVDDPLDAVLIDDDELVVLTWKLAASEAKKKLATFSSHHEFLQEADQIAKQVPIYIDSNLGDGTKGELVAERIYNLGFSTIYLATGYTCEHIGSYKWIKELRSKNPPWQLTEQMPLVSGIETSVLS